MTGFPSWDLRRIPIPPEIEQSIVTPHSHENLEVAPADHEVYAGQPFNRPLWLIWTREPIRRDAQDHLDMPILDSVCDTEESARTHYRMAVESHPRSTIDVERIPANHRFASSLGDWQHAARVAYWRLRSAQIKRDGD